MNLPNPDQLRVDHEKITDYLLSVTHSEGSGKAEFFARFGFHLADWEVLANALRKHGASHPVVKIVASSHGTRYAVEGELESPDGRNPRVRTIWIVEKGSTAPRLVTALPVED
jgi:hypothetical protein